MKVSELIHQLKDLPPDTLVYVWNDGERLELSMVDDSFAEEGQFVDLNVNHPVGWTWRSFFIVKNHNGTELGRFDTASRAQEEVNFYMEQTGNPAYVEEQLA